MSSDQLEAFVLDYVRANARSLSQSTLQVIANLDMFNAELARLLRLKCNDIGCLASAASTLVPGSCAWHEAEKFVHFYQLLYRMHDGNGVAMRHWLRVPLKPFNDTPHRLIVDEQCLGDVISYPESRSRD